MTIAELGSLGEIIGAIATVATLLYLAAQIRALELKLTDYLPIGQEIAIRYDPYLSRPPARIE